MRRALVLPALAAALLLAGCAPTVSLRPAPHATSVGCAGVVVRMPKTIGTAALRPTDAQGTAAWGTPASVTLTCGVVPPVTTDCTTIDGVDWLTQQRTIDGADWRVFTSYGRDPSTQVLVNPNAVLTDTVLGALSEPVATATARTGARCLAPTDAP
jgi:hypothetical protein